MVLAEGAEADSLYFLMTGSVKVTMSDTEGEEVILAILKQGDFFGEMAIIDEYPRSANIVTLEACEMVVMEKNEFLKGLSNNFDLTLQIMRGLSKRLREADKRIESLALVNVYGRVAQMLVEVSEVMGGMRMVNKKLTRQDIARMVGASREMVSRVLHDLADGDYIRMDGRRILLRDKLVTYAHEMGRSHGG
ncbi:MAG TPA: Crp/Fnr family transcriptional regulator, partial [Burkholderiales bacterium]|nr:Crp/Fnr family transcriptional regulator [Burkholderiales bacterium]